MTPPDLAIETEGLTRYFGETKAVDSLNLGVPAGSVFALLGRNGSGKTTLIKMLLGFLQPTDGSSRVLGSDSLRLSPMMRGEIGYMAESHPLHESMTVEEAGWFASRLYERWNAKLFDSVIKHFGLKRNARAESLSRGQRAGLALALTLAPEPALVLLDDPAKGLDPVARRAVLDKMLQVTRDSGRTVLFSSHQLDDVEHIADHVAVMRHGQLRTAGAVDDIMARTRRVRMRYAPGAMPRVLPSMPDVIEKKRNGDTLVVTGTVEDQHGSLFGADAAKDGFIALRNIFGGHERIIEVKEIPLSFPEAMMAYMDPEDEDGSEQHSLN